ncbi:MAG: homoserine O-acetyltransferase [Propionibacteriaceae bacterium]|jgi:homoserine O-acetyltransferase|nr:homoserine O-acetyltransferase [Propionibacteriaceae bacterium]
MNLEVHDATLFTAQTPLKLARGGQLGPITIHYETYGRLDSTKSNAVFVCHALTGDAHAAGWHPGQAKPGWWDSMIGPGKPVDTDTMFVICANLLGGCQGSTGPGSIDPTTQASYGLAFPILDMRDFVTVHRALVAHLGIKKLLAVVGGSLGGMQALQWALSAPQDMRNAVIIAASSRLTAQNIAFSAVAREAIMRDRGFAQGHYLEQGTSPDAGLSIARMMAHITYTSESTLGRKFGREPHKDDLVHGFGVDFAVESYLKHQADVFLDRFDALSYLYLSRVMDYFDPFARDDACRLIGADPVAVLVCSFSTDWRFSPAQSLRIVAKLERAGVPVTYREIDSGMGHDSFLMPIPPYHDVVRAFLTRAVSQIRPATSLDDLGGRS